MPEEGLNGTYIAVEPVHLDRDVDEQVFCFNQSHNKGVYAARFKAVLKDIFGRRLTYADLTGKRQASAAFYPYRRGGEEGRSGFRGRLDDVPEQRLERRILFGYGRV